jgi:peptidoglycan/LPS O-acetylase OafA/YrhL
MSGSGSGYEYGTFYYFSGYIGYIVLAHYIRTYINWSWKMTLAIALPLLVAGYLTCFYSFYSRSLTAKVVEDLEHGWNNCGIAVVVMTTAMFLLLKNISKSEGFVYNVVKDISAKSYGMYLLHMMFLPLIYVQLKPVLPVPMTIICTAVGAYVVSYMATKLISLIPKSKYIIG